MAFVYVVPPQQVTSASEFARRAGEAMLGRSGPAVLASIVVLSVCGQHSWRSSSWLRASMWR